MVGMYPEMIYLDAHLNQDTHESVDQHCNLILYLPNDEQHKYSNHIPTKLWKRVWDPEIGTEGGEPFSAQIQEDIKRVIDNTYLSAFDHHVRVLDTSAYNGRHAQLYKEMLMAPWGDVCV